jgi:hypothetical protein
MEIKSMRRRIIAEDFWGLAPRPPWVRFADLIVDTECRGFDGAMSSPGIWYVTAGEIQGSGFKTIGKSVSSFCIAYTKVDPSGNRGTPLGIENF